MSNHQILESNFTSSIHITLKFCRGTNSLGHIEKRLISAKLCPTHINQDISLQS